MKILLKTDATDWRVDTNITVRLLVINDSYEPVALDRQLLAGPNPVPEHPVGIPYPISIEPAFDEENQNIVMLNPWCFYGRERSFDNLPAGTATFYAYLLKHTGSFMPKSANEAENLAAEAQPLIIKLQLA